MKTRFKFAFLAPIALVSIAADAPGTMQAGRWATKLTFTGAKMGDQEISGESLAQMNQEKFTCISAADAADPQTYIARASNKKACKVVEAPRVSGKLDFVLDCSDAEASGQIKIKGDYTSTNYTGDMVADVKMGGNAITLFGKISASHAGACTGDEAS